MFIVKVYLWLLWYFGFSDTDGRLDTPNDREMITFMLRRAQQRMGIVWWILSLGTILGVWTLTLLVSWWWVLAEMFLLWLFVHILVVYTAPEDIWTTRK